MVNLLHTRNNTVLDWYLDQYMWYMMQVYFAPYRLPDLFSDADKWVASVSTNGARWPNLCRPG
jgi:hypothetical protein